MKDDKRYPLLKIPKGEKLPRFQLARVRKDDGARYFGPFVHSQALYATQEWLNRCGPARPKIRVSTSSSTAMRT